MAAVGTHSGVVAKWLNHKGMGFITPDSGGEDLFCHFSAIKQDEEGGFRSLAWGAKVRYNTKPDPKDETKVLAVDITSPDGGAPEAKGKGRGWIDDEEEEPRERTRATEGDRGVVAKWLNHKGIGFITPDKPINGGGDLLVHFTDIYAGEEGKFRSLQEGSRVEYDTKPDPKNADTVIATNVTAVGGGEPRSKGKGKGKGKGGGGGGKGKGKDSGKGKGKNGKGKY